MYVCPTQTHRVKGHNGALPTVSSSSPLVGLALCISACPTWWRPFEDRGQDLFIVLTIVLSIQ